VTAFLDYAFCWGARAGVRDNVVHTGETSIVYPAGRHLCVYSTETKEMSFLLQAESVESVVAMAASHNRKYLGVCEVLAEGAAGQVTIFNVASEKRYRTLTHPDCKTFTAITFSSDSKFLVTIGSAPDFTMVYWNWFQSKVVATVKVNSEIKRVSFSPLDNVQIATSGPGLLKLWRLQEATLKGFNMVSGKAAAQNFTDHSWAPGDRLLASTDQGDVLVVEQGELRSTVKTRFSGTPIHTLVAYSSGFIIAGSEGRMSVYEKNDARDKGDDKEPYHHFKTFKSPEAHNIVSLSISPAEEHLGAFFSSNQVAIFPIANIDILKEDVNHFSFVGSGFHSASITGLDVCVRKPLVATCGADRSVRVWNYLDKSCEVCRVFQDDLTSIAIHPSGFHVLVGFSDKLRLFNVLIDDLKQFQEFPLKSCREVRFSHGGHRFAAVNITNIIIFDTYTFQRLGVLVSHTALVKSVCWSQDDFKMVSAGIDGAVYEWSLQGFARTEENVTRNVHYSCVVYNQAGNAAIGCGDDHKITEFIKSAPSREVKTQGIRVTQLLLSNNDKILFAGTTDGAVQSYIWAMDSTEGIREGQQYLVSKGAVTRMGASADESQLFLASEDGTLFMFDVHLMEEGEVAEKKAIDPANFLDVVLVTRADVEEKTSTMQDLENKIGEVQVQAEYKLHLHDQDWAEKTKKMKEETEAARGAAEARFEALRRRKEQQELEAVEAIQNMERAHMKAAEELESLYEKKLAIEAQRYRGLLHEKEDMECSYEEQLEITKSKYNSVIMKLKNEYEAKTKEQQDAYYRLKDELANTKAQYEEFVRQQDEDHEDEVLKVQQVHKRQLEEEQEAVLNLKSQSAIMRRRFDSFKSDMEELRSQLKHKGDDLKTANEKNEEQERQIQMLKNDIRDREQTIDNKEKRISELRMKAKELEKIKFVLDYKYKELKKEIEPKETQIQHMKGQIKEMDEELERDVRTNHALGQALNDKTHKIDNLNLEIKRQRGLVHEKDRLIQLFVTDLEKLVTEIDPSYWRDAIRQLYRTYVKKGSKEQGARDVPDSMDEFARQREYMERSLETLKKRATKNEEAVKINNQKKSAENALLIDELNSLRREKRLLEVKVQEMQSELQLQNAQRMRRGRSGSADEEGRPLRSETPTSAANASSRPPSKGGRVHKGSALSMNEQVSNERAKVMAMLQQLDESNREIEGQRFEIKRLREQVQILLQRAPLADAQFMEVMGMGGSGDMAAHMGDTIPENRSATAPLQRPGATPPIGQLVKERSRSSMAKRPPT